jgi:hypothetical protein
MDERWADSDAKWDVEMDNIYSLGFCGLLEFLIWYYLGDRCMAYLVLNYHPPVCGIKKSEMTSHLSLYPRSIPYVYLHHSECH